MSAATMHEARVRTRGYDLSHARRDARTEREMFIQIGIGNVVEGEGVRKDTAISFTMPYIPGVGQEITQAVASVFSEFSGLSENVKDFHGNGALVATFGQSEEQVGAAALQKLSTLFQAVGDIAIKYRDEMSDEAFQKFMGRILNYQLMSENLIRDGESILSNPAHGGSVAYRNKELFGDQHLYRMEWIDDGTAIRTPAPPHQGYEMSVVDEKISKDEADIAFTLAMLAFRSMAFKSKAKTVMFVQANATSAVKDCAGNQSYNYHYNSIAITTSTSSSNNPGQSNSTIQFMMDNARAVQGGDGEAGNSSQSEGKVACSKCGKMNDRSIPMCACTLAALKKGAAAVSVRHHH